jgi:hypothetical protein
MSSNIIKRNFSSEEGVEKVRHGPMVGGYLVIDITIIIINCCENCLYVNQYCQILSRPTVLVASTP